MMTVEQAMDAIRNGHTIAATHDVVIAAYARLRREAQADAAAMPEATLDELEQAYDRGHRDGYENGWRDGQGAR